MKGLRVIYIQEQDGSLLVKGEDDFGENIATRYDPPIPVFPAKISESTIAKGKCSMRVVGLNDGLPRDSGTCEYETTLLGMKKIKTPGGTFDAYFIRTVRHMKLRFATAVITVVEAYVPDHGLVSEHVHRKSRMLGLIEKTVIEEFALSEHGLPDR
jgi:hypothetical protein